MSGENISLEFITEKSLVDSMRAQNRSFEDKQTLIKWFRSTFGDREKVPIKEFQEKLAEVNQKIKHGVFSIANDLANTISGCAVTALDMNGDYFITKNDSDNFVNQIQFELNKKCITIPADLVMSMNTICKKYENKKLDDWDWACFIKEIKDTVRLIDTNNDGLLSNEEFKNPVNLRSANPTNTPLL
jgi:hypothetical protein